MAKCLGEVIKMTCIIKVASYTFSVKIMDFVNFSVCFLMYVTLRELSIPRLYDMRAKCNKLGTRFSHK